MKSPIKVTAHDLDDHVEFDGPFTIDENGMLSRSDVWAPSVYHVDGEREPDIDGTGWEFVDGYSGQFRYSGPAMHPSEYLGGGMARDVLDTPGTYVLCVVEDLDDMDNPAGWVLLRRTRREDEA